MDEEVRKRLEYEEQFFGMSSQFFADCFKKLLLDEIEAKVKMLVDNFRGKLIQQTNSPEHFELALEKMKESLNNEYKNSVENSFPDIETAISDFMQIPSTVLLKEDVPVRIWVNGNLDEIRRDVENLKGTFLSLVYMKQKILEEHEEADSTIFIMEHIINGKKLDFDVLPVEEISALSRANNYLIKNEF